MRIALSRTLACLMTLSCTAWAQEGNNAQNDKDAYKFHMELKKGDWAGMKKDDPCGKLTFKDSKSKKNGAVVEEIEYKTLKHSKIEEIDDECAKRQLMKKKMLAAEGDYDKLDAKHKRIGKRLAILDKADEAIEAEMKNELEDLKKKKMRGAKKKLSGEINSTRSKCDPRQTMLKC